MGDPQHVFIVGGSSDLGIALARALIIRGCTVLNYDIVSPPIENISGLGDMYLFRGVDLAKPEESSRVLESDMVRLCRNSTSPSALLYCARGRCSSCFDDLDYDEYIRVLDVVLSSAVFMSKVFVRYCQPNSSVILTSSLSSSFVSDESLPYQLGKAAMNHLSRYLAVSCRSKGVRSLAVLPGLIIQDRHLERYTDDTNASYRDLCSLYQPNKQTGRTEDIVRVFVSLLLDMPYYLNGNLITLDGGASCQDHFALANRINNAHL